MFADLVVFLVCVRVCVQYFAILCLSIYQEFYEISSSVVVLGGGGVFVDRNDELRTCYAMMMQVVATCVYDVKYEIEVR